MSSSSDCDIFPPTPNNDSNEQVHEGVSMQKKRKKKKNDSYKRKSKNWKTEKRRQARQKEREEKRNLHEPSTSTSNNDLSQTEINDEGNKEVAVEKNKKRNLHEPSTSTSNNDLSQTEINDKGNKEVAVEKNKQSQFMWPHQKITTAKQAPPQTNPQEKMETYLKKEQEHNQVLQRQLSTVTADLVDLKERHAHCVHERIRPAVLSRTMTMVEAVTILSSGYCYMQPELDEVDHEGVADLDVDFRKKQLFRSSDDSSVYIIPSNNPTLYVIDYTNRFNKATLEFKVLKMNTDVEGIQRPVGLYRKEDACHVHCLVTTSPNIPMKDDTMVTASNISAQKGIDVSKEQWLQIFMDTAKALQGLHDNGFIHNQVRPDNIQLVYKRRGNKKKIRAELIDMSLSCMEKYSRKLTEIQVFSLSSLEHNFLDPVLLKRATHPSKVTDVYAFGQTIQHVAVQNDISSRVRSLADQCMQDSFLSRPNMYDICRQIYLIGQDMQFTVV
ncbi:uncharacterized protein [Amphiura filiformis]|uniref:uncharacterized protein n=1 Tax=Amphiura filiformis TaxID=82378 RepID=UPI003B227747